MQESSCQHNIHYYSDKNRVAFTSISRRQHYSLLQNSIKNRRSRVNCHLAAESQNCLPLLQIDQVWSRGGNGLSLWWGSQGSEQAVAPSTQKSLGVEPKKSGWSRFQHLPLEVIESDGLQGLEGFFSLPDPPGSGFSGHRISCKVVQKHRKLQPWLPKY